MTDEQPNVLQLDVDPRPAFGFWAPGHYTCICASCGKGFLGDKRAVNCADCAYEGQYPDGKMDDYDEGEVSVKVGLTGEKKIGIEFPKPVQWFALPPDAAKEFVSMIQKYIDLAEE